mgnify:CR=1 FL=1
MVNFAELKLPDQSLENLRRFDRFWHGYRLGKLTGARVPELVRLSGESLRDLEFDVVVAGGTLGIIVGLALQNLGWRVAVVERGVLRGRVQEWNIARRELEVLVELELLTQPELESVIVTEYNPGRLGFGGREFWVRDVLNLGVSPLLLLELLKQKFVAGGGSVVERSELLAVEVCSNGVMARLGQGWLKARLLVDVMGHFSPITAQARADEVPDGICMVVGSCAEGMPNPGYGDLFYSFRPIGNFGQDFWEAFPAEDGRTTYRFCYGDLEPGRLGFEQLFEEYVAALPEYQGVDVAELGFKRLLYGFFPSYRRSPLVPSWDRVVAVGDSSGSQSPLSFGGFGALLRHLPRLREGIDLALRANLLSKGDLAWVQPYQPSLSVTWLFQEAMRVKVGAELDPEAINRLLGLTFEVMTGLGDGVLRPFLQDVVQLPGLSRTLVGMLLADPGLVAGIVGRVGLPSLIGWLGDFGALVAYDLAFRAGGWAEPWLKNLLPEQEYGLRGRLRAWQYGAGLDYRGGN